MYLKLCAHTLEGILTETARKCPTISETKWSFPLSLAYKVINPRFANPVFNGLVQQQFKMTLFSLKLTALKPI